MFSHVTIGTNDHDKACAFYDAVLGALGIARYYRDEHSIGYSKDPSQRKDQVWILTPFDDEPAVPGNGVHIAFEAASRAQVDAFYAAALAHGGADDGPPGLRPHYHADYYGTYVRDPDGNKLQAVCHSPSG